MPMEYGWLLPCGGNGEFARAALRSRQRSHRVFADSFFRLSIRVRLELDAEMRM